MWKIVHAPAVSLYTPVQDQRQKLFASKLLVASLWPSIDLFHLFDIRSCTFLCIDARLLCSCSISQIRLAALRSNRNRSFSTIICRILRQRRMPVITGRGKCLEPSALFSSRTSRASLRTDVIRKMIRFQSNGASLKSTKSASKAAIMSRLSRSIVTLSMVNIPRLICVQCWTLTPRHGGRC